jgi:hypothetical protein
MKLKKDNPPHAAGESNALEGRSTAGGGTAFQACKSHERAKPPARGLRLGLRLGLTTSLIVSLVLGTLMILHQGRETGREWKAREDLLKESLSPLASDIETPRVLKKYNRDSLSFTRATSIAGTRITR